MRNFTGFGSFAKHLAALSLEGDAVMHEIAEKGGKMIQHAAQDKFGQYQAEVGPFNAWSELADATKDDRVAKGFSENDPLLRAGQLRDEIELVVEGPEAVVASMDPIMLWQECGTDDGHIPPRPVLGPAAFESKPKLAALSFNTSIAWVSGLGWHRPRKFISGPPGSEE